MAIAGSMDQWRSRLKMATDAELAILDQDSDPNSELRPILSDEILRRSTSQGQNVAQAPLAVAPNVPVTIPTAPAALASVPDAPPPPGGRGSPPSDPVTLASRAQRAIEGGDQDTAIKLYDFGLETHGQAFVSAFDALDREPPKSGLPRTEGGRGGALGHGGLPRSAAGRDDQEINPPGVPAAPPPGSVPVPDQPVATPLSKDGPLPVVRPDPLIKVGDAAGLPPDPTGTGYQMTLNGLPRAGGDKDGALGYGGLPRSAAGRDDQEINPPGLPAAAPVANLDRSLEDVSQHSIAPIAPGPVDRTVTSEELPVAAGLRSVSMTRGPMTTAAGTSEGRMFYDRPVTSQGPYGDEGTDRPRRRKDGSYYDPPVGPQVIAIEDHYETPAGRNLPRGGTKLAADPGSGGLASAVTVPMRPEPKPVVDTGTSNPAPTTPPNKSGSVVDTNTPAADDSGFMSKPDIWSFLTSAGLGMMSSQSPDFLGAVGAGGTAGINQLGVLRKDQRERAKNLADARFQKDRIAVSREAEVGQNQRTDRTIASQERINERNNQGLDRRQQTGIGAEQQNLQTRLQFERDQAERNSQLKITEAEYADRIRDGNLKDDPETKFNFFKSKGHSDEDASRMAGGFSPPTERTDKMSPMGEKEVAQSLDIAAGTLLGEGATGNQLLAQLPPAVASDVLKALSTQQDSGGGARAVLDTLRKHGITVKDGSFFGGIFGKEPYLAAPKMAPAPAETGGGGGGGYVYVPGKGVVPK